MTRGKAWRLDHNPAARPLGCNGKYGNSGATKHRRRGEKPCAKCKESEAHYGREYRRGGIKPRPLKPCGTPAAAERHRWRGEPIDMACRLALAAQQQEKRDRRKSAAAAKQGPEQPFLSR